jgi:RNA ligase (TIGR02306 family)
MRKLASLQRIRDVQPIEGADRIEKISVLGWQLVSQKGNFKPNDMCVYFEIDSLLPIHPAFEFLRKGSYKKMADGSEGFRLKTIVLKGVVSQGLALPLDFLSEEMGFKIVSVAGDPRWETIILDEVRNIGVPLLVGEDLTDLLGVVKYEPPVPACLSGEAIGYVPGWLVTDETRVQVLEKLLEKYERQEFYVTEKLDGSSFTAFIDEEKNLHVCSRNLDLLKNEDNSLWKWAIKNDLEEKMRALDFRACIQGEIYGEGIQGNRYQRSSQDVKFFNVIDMEKRTLLNIEDTVMTLMKLSLTLVPHLGTIKLPNSVSELVEFSKGKSKLNPSANREGIVLRPLQTSIDTSYDTAHSRVSFKVINPEFLLDGGD